MIAQTAINYSEFLVISRHLMQYSEIEGVLYVTDGTRTWQMQEVTRGDETKES